MEDTPPRKRAKIDDVVDLTGSASPKAPLRACELCKEETSEYVGCRKSTTTFFCYECCRSWIKDDERLTIGVLNKRCMCRSSTCTLALDEPLLQKILPKEKFDSFVAKRNEKAIGPLVGACRECNFTVEVSPSAKVAPCPQCNAVQCWRCKGKHAEEESCKRLSFRDLASERAVPSCPWCGVATVKSEDCNHMTCPSCKNHWCYKCGEKLYDIYDIEVHYTTCDRWTDRSLEEDFQRELRADCPGCGHEDATSPCPGCGKDICFTCDPPTVECGLHK